MVTGDALVDFVLEADGGTTPHLGGGSFNAARTLGRLGLRPVFIGRLSSDRYGRGLRAALEESGVRLDAVVPTDDPTTFARVEIDGFGAANYRFYVEGTSSAGLRADEARAAMPPRPAGLHVGGLGLAVEPQARAMTSLAREAGPETLVLVDPNCRAETVRAPATSIASACANCCAWPTWSRPARRISRTSIPTGRRIRPRAVCSSRGLRWCC